MTDLEDMRDAALFRFWCRIAEAKPGKVANALLRCHTADDYRAALMLLASAERINIPGAP